MSEDLIDPKNLIENAAPSSDGLQITRRAVLGVGVTGIGTALFQPALASISRYSFSAESTNFVIRDAYNTWELKSKRFGAKCRLSISSKESDIYIETTHAVLEGTDFFVDFIFTISRLRDETAEISCRSRQLGIDATIRLADWLSGKAHFESNGRTFSFSSLVNPEIRCLGRITSLDRDWIIRVGEGAIRSVNFPTIPTTFIEIGASRGRDVYGTTVKGPAVDHLHALAFT
ncbi:hypothetical protein ACE04B_37110, partial [Rhizobium phaseoli]